MFVRNLSHRYYYKFANIRERFFISLCVFGLVFGSGLVISLLDNTPKSTLQQSAFSSLRKTEWSPSLSRKVDGCEKYNLQGSETAYLAFEGFGSCKKTSLREINFEFVQLDAKFFTDSLQGCTNLEVLNMNYVNLTNENFRRVYLPKLSRYHFDRTIRFHEQYRDYANYTRGDKLFSMLFFDKTEGQNVGLNEIILKSNVNIRVRVDGWSVISIQNGTEIILAVKFANDILMYAKAQNISQRVTSLTLTECTVSNEFIPRNLNYLNLYNIEIKNRSLTKLLNSMDRLQSLFIEAPSTEILLHHLPLKIDDISFSSINLTYTDGDCINATNVELGFISNSKIFENFHTLFPAVKNVAIFEPGPLAHVLLFNILKTGANRVLFKDFSRKEVNEHDEMTQIETDIETFLIELKISADIKDFLLEKNQNTWTGRSVSQKEGLQLRYQLLGWEKYITTKAYAELY